MEVLRFASLRSVVMRISGESITVIQYCVTAVVPTECHTLPVVPTECHTLPVVTTECHTLPGKILVANQQNFQFLLAKLCHFIVTREHTLRASHSLKTVSGNHATYQQILRLFWEHCDLHLLKLMNMNMNE